MSLDTPLVPGGAGGAGSGAGATAATQADHSYSFKATDLHVPDSHDVVAALQRGLAPYFSAVDVELVECPDLRGTSGAYGWGMARAGLGDVGEAVVLDLGSVTNLLEPTNQWRHYELETVLDAAGLGSRPCVLGAGAGAPAYAGCVAEAMPNLWFGPKRVNLTKYSTVNTDGTIRQGDYPGTSFGMFQNLLATNGDTGKVLHVKVHGRKTDTNFHNAVKAALEAGFEGADMAVGGVFVLRSAPMNIHVMDSVPTKTATQDELMGSLKRFEVSAEHLTCLTTIVTGSSLRPLNNPHTHCFSTVAGEVGGHYHFDTNAETARYEAFFVVAKSFVLAEQEGAAPTCGCGSKVAGESGQ